MNFPKFTDKIKPASQTFSFYTEEFWQLQKENYPEAVAGLFSGKKGENFIYLDGGQTHYLIGLGTAPKTYDLHAAAAKFSNDFSAKIKEKPTLLALQNFTETEMAALSEGLLFGTYRYPFKERHPFYGKKFELMANLSAKSVKEISQRVKAITKGSFACMEWLNKPRNQKTVAEVVDFLKKTSEDYGFKISVFDRKKCEKLGLGAFLAVNQGSAQEAAFTVIEYRGGKKTDKTVGLVGKCVLFDTGGISLKPGENMHYMKSDMGGATAVIGTLIAAAELRLPINITAVLPITDNAISNDAYTPSDVITAYNGKTIEILNTDAEGRMTLADGVSYISKNYKTDAMIDIATLTGSAVRMFGYTCGAILSNDDSLRDALIKSGDNVNQRLWNLPLWDVWAEDIKSDVADFKNISSKPFGDCIVAGKFIEQFIEGHSSWAHLDIAGVAFGNTLYSKEKAATGYGVKLLIDFLENYL